MVRARVASATPGTIISTSDVEELVARGGKCAGSGDQPHNALAEALAAAERRMARAVQAGAGRPRSSA